MMDLSQLMTAAQACKTRREALELVRREAQSVANCFEEVTPEQARTKVLGDIAYSTGAGMSREESARVMDLFQVEHPYFGGDIANWPKTPEETIQLGYQMGLAMRETGKILMPPVAK